MSETSHDARRDELASYLLGALDPGEMADLERHLAGCEDCRRELERLRPAALALPETVERVEPPPGLRARVMEEVQADAAVRPERKLIRWPRSGGLRVATGLAVFALLAAVAVGYAIRGDETGGGTKTEVAGTASCSTHAALTTGCGAGVTAEMVREGEAGTLRMANVEQLPSDEVLQAWVQRGGRVESAGVLFEPDTKGDADAAIDDMSGVEAVMVTVEPHGGSEAPTSKPLISVPINSS